MVQVRQRRKMVESQPNVICQKSMSFVLEGRNLPTGKVDTESRAGKNRSSSHPFMSGISVIISQRRLQLNTGEWSAAKRTFILSGLGVINKSIVRSAQNSLANTLTVGL